MGVLARGALRGFSKSTKQKLLGTYCPIHQDSAVSDEGEYPALQTPHIFSNPLVPLIVQLPSSESSPFMYSGVSIVSRTRRSCLVMWMYEYVRS